MKIKKVLFSFAMSCLIFLSSCSNISVDQLNIPKTSEYSRTYSQTTNMVLLSEVQSINPKWGQSGYNNNCALCTTCVELRKRGYAVQAGKCYYGTYTGREIRWWKGLTLSDIERYDADEVEEELEDKGVGASGHMSISWGTTRHAVHWDINNAGELIIEDGQVGKIYISFDDFISHFGDSFNEDEAVIIMRFDDCEPNWGNLIADGVIDNIDEIYIIS